VLLAGAECRFTCTFCDLWRHTLDGPTPPGTLPRQLDEAIAAAGALPPKRAIKLYNASNFFDPRAVPPGDFARIAEAVEPFDRVVVESHARLVGRSALEFADLLHGRLEVALGLEVADNALLTRLNKGMTLEDFELAGRVLTDAGVAVRAFVLLAPPFVSRDEVVGLAVRSVAYAADRGAGHVSLIPTRGTTGAMEALRRSGDFAPPTLEQAEDAFERALQAIRTIPDSPFPIPGSATPDSRSPIPDSPVVTLDLWDAERLASCARCGPRRLDRLAAMNLSGRPASRTPCPQCGWH
jgi:radical SAM enzyme (TIGR01210 family)